MTGETQAASSANLIRTGRAARLLGCSPSYLLALTRAGKISTQVIDGVNHYPKASIEALARARRQASSRTTDATLAGVLREAAHAN